MEVLRFVAYSILVAGGVTSFLVASGLIVFHCVTKSGPDNNEMYLQ